MRCAIFPLPKGATAGCATPGSRVVPPLKPRPEARQGGGQSGPRVRPLVVAPVWYEYMQQQSTNFSAKQAANKRLARLEAEFGSLHGRREPALRECIYTVPRVKVFSRALRRRVLICSHLSASRAA